MFRLHRNELAESPSTSPSSDLADRGSGATVNAEMGQRSRLGLAYGQFIYRFRWLVIVLWIVVTASSLYFAGQISSVLQGGSGSLSGTQSAQVSSIMTDTLGRPRSQLAVVFQSSDVPAADPAYQHEIRDFISRAQAFPHVTSATAGGVGTDGHTAVVFVNFDTDTNYVQQHLADFRKLVPGSGTADQVQVHVTGLPALNDALNQVTGQDTRNSLRPALLLALVILLMVFGTLTAASMPLLLGLVAVPVALATLYGIAVHEPISSLVTNVIQGIGLGIAIDYSLFMTRRFREELSRGRSVQDAVAMTVATSGEAVLFSGLLVMIGFSGLLLIGFSVVSSFGIGGATVVAVAVVAALTLLPAILGVLGPRINAVRVPIVSRFVGVGSRRLGETSSSERSETTGLWHRWALAVMAHPIVSVLLVGLILVLMAFPLFSIQIGNSGTSSLPTTTEARQGLDILTAQFPAYSQQPVLVVAQTADGSSMLSADNLARLDQLTRWISAQAHVTQVTSLTRPPAVPGIPSPSEQQLAALYTSGSYQQNAALGQFVGATTKGGTTLITVQTDATQDSQAAFNLVDTLRVHASAVGQVLHVLVGGTVASDLDFDRHMYGNFPRAIAFILVATYVLLLLMFRSVLLPLKAILMNVLSVGAACGVLVFIFQWGHLQRILDFTSLGFLENTVPILLFCILFGLSMDYEVFLLSRIHEEWLRTHNNTYSVARGLEKTGGVITSAALIFVVVIGSTAFTRLLVTKEVGLGMALAVLVDATIIRSLLVPAMMRLIGRWNWWLPGRHLPKERPMPTS
ncbi:MAG TPA: MMPL family transporter [Ktedonobacterales bacterium]|nr:MMPL family transporter [Ktedonobacterales bacterium]